MQESCRRFIQDSIRMAQCDYEPMSDTCDCDEDAIRAEYCESLSQATRRRQRKCDAAASQQHCECDFTQGEDCDIPVMVMIEPQEFCRMYNEAEGLRQGTMFPALDKPFLAKGGNRCG